MPQDLPVILHNEKRGLLTFEDGKLDVLQLSRDGRPPKRLLTCPARNFLRARLAPTQPGKPVRLDLHTLVGKGNNLRLSKMHVLVEPINQPEAEEWVEMVMEAAYVGSKPGRKVLLLVNPVGGKGKARATVKNDVLPILEAAGCMVEVRETTHRYHAQEIVEKIDLIYDVIAPVSGDGLIYEVFNGLAIRPDARRALKTPIGPIPTGSANSLCINLFGPDDTFNIPLACLNVIKGQHMPKDLYSVYFLQSQKRVWSFLATAMGLMVDLDIGTEHLRWMGDMRFTLGFIKGVAVSRNHLCRIKMRVVAEDKVEMARAAREWAAEVKGKKVVGGGVDPVTNGMKKLQVNGTTKTPVQPRDGKTANGETTNGSANGPTNGHSAGDDSDALPDSKPLAPDDSWTIIESGSKSSVSKQQREVKAASTGRSGGWIDGEGVMYAYLGSVPWIARDLMQWPVAMQNSGAFDVVIQSVVPRATMLSAITGAAKGEQYWMECQHYYKIDAMVVENLDKKNQKIMSVDGEAFPYEDFQIEMHPGLGTILSLDGHFFISEFLQKTETRR